MLPLVPKQEVPVFTAGLVPLFLLKGDGSWRVLEAHGLGAEVGSGYTLPGLNEKLIFSSVAEK